MLTVFWQRMERTVNHLKVSPSGKWAFVASLLLIMSISAGYRLSIAGLLVHPYLFLLPIAILLNKSNILGVPAKVLNPLILFFVIFSLASLRNASPFSEIFKVMASLLTFLFFATSIKTEMDFRTTCWGFILCGLAIGIRGFLISDAGEVNRLSGINALEGLGNKNAQSLFTLPAIFFGLMLWLKYFSDRKISRLISLTAILFFILVSVFISANRSGWLGLGIIGVVFMIFTGVNSRAIVLATVIGIISYVSIEKYAIDIVEHKREQTLKGYASDRGRELLALQAIQVGLENPLLGVGKDELHRQMALRLNIAKHGLELIDTHILWGYLFGATGIFSLIFFLWFLRSLTSTFPQFGVSNVTVRKVRVLMIGFVALFIIRALFTREILYSPTFMGGLGLLFGYYLCNLRYARSIRI